MLRRMLFSHLLIVLIGFALVGLMISWLTKGYIHENKREQLFRQARIVNVNMPQPDQDLGAAVPSMLRFLEQAFGAQIWVFDRTGKIIATSQEKDIFVGKSVTPEILDAVLGGRDVSSVRFDGLPEPMLSVVVPWGQADQIRGGIILHSPVQGINQTAARIRETILWATVAAMLVSSVAGTYIFWTIVRPLRRIERVAAEIGAGHYDRRVEYHSNDEIGDLAATINSMAAKLAGIEAERRALEQAREDLFANISHDLRAPLTAILGFLEALQDGIAESREEEQRYLAVTYREALHLNELVNDLLDLTRLAAGKVTLYKVPVDLAGVAREVCSQMEHAARQQGNTLELSVGAGLPQALGDPVRLRQILSNLTGNAIKFTRDGRITMTLAQESGGVTVEVSDTGIGIAPQDLPSIWDRFYKGDRMRTRGRGGSGLGLAIVKELVDLHDGRVHVESQLGRGTIFRVWLPSVPGSSSEGQAVQG